MELLLVLVSDSHPEVLSVFRSFDSWSKRGIKRVVQDSARRHYTGGKIQCKYRSYSIEVDEHNSDFIYDDFSILDLYSKDRSFSLFEKELGREYVFSIRQVGAFSIQI